MRRFCVFVAVLVYGVVGVPSSAQDHPYSASVFGSFSTSSKLFHHPDDSNELVRSQFFPLNSIFSAGIDIRRTLESIGVQIGVNIEFISKSNTSTVPDSIQTVPVVDGFFAVPIELSGYFFIPVGNENIRLYMGGGAGVYFGDRQYEYAEAEAATIDKQTGYGIHILSGVEYTVSKTFSLRSELKFRDVQFEAVKRFTTFTTLYQGNTISLSQDPLPSRINIDGMHLTVGVAYHF